MNAIWTLVIELLTAAPAVVQDVESFIASTKTSANGQSVLTNVLATLKDVVTRIEAAIEAK